MISHSNKCIFVAVPKTGSTSIRAVLGGYSPKPHLNIWQIKNELQRHWTGHDPSKPFDSLQNRIKEAAYLLLPAEKRKRKGEHIFDSYFKFGFVRNPWDRAVSLYERREGFQLRGQKTFEEFVEWMTHASSTCIHPAPHRYQLDWFTDPHGAILVNYIGRLENLEKDWAQICQNLGIQRNLPRLNLNPRRQRHYSEYYTPKTRALINDRFRVDIEYFGYEFEPSANTL